MANKRIQKKRTNSDECYVVNLCDEILGLKAHRQHCFDFLRGDSCKDGVLTENTGKMLPVDAFYEELNLVIEYWEKQHTEPIPYFDNKRTCCGLTRKEQREKYDNRRKDLLPKKGMTLLIIQYSEFGIFKRIKRNHDRDIAIVKKILADNNILTNDN